MLTGTALRIRSCIPNGLSVPSPPPPIGSRQAFLMFPVGRGGGGASGPAVSKLQKRWREVALSQCHNLYSERQIILLMYKYRTLAIIT